MQIVAFIFVVEPKHLFLELTVNRASLQNVQMKLLKMIHKSDTLNMHISTQGSVVSLKQSDAGCTKCIGLTGRCAVRN